MTPLGTHGRFPVAPLRDAFEASGLGAYDLALRMGWYERGTPDSYRVRRVLGLCTYSPGNGFPSRHREHVSEQMAARLAEAMGLLPVEIGL